MEEQKLKAAKMHYEALMSKLDELGLSLAEFEDQMEGEKPGEEEGGDYQEPMGEEEGMGMKKGMDKGKIAVIVAKMKNGKKAMEE